MHRIDLDADRTHGGAGLSLTGFAAGKSLPEQLHTRWRKRSMSLIVAGAETGLSPMTIAGLERGRGSVASLLRPLAVIAPTARGRAPRLILFWTRGQG